MPRASGDWLDGEAVSLDACVETASATDEAPSRILILRAVAAAPGP